jgi:selenocysteine-specific elongation factor
MSSSSLMLLCCLQKPMPQQLQHLNYNELQFTLVDCPGHASLIRTIIGGAQIIDMMVLVIEVTKGKQQLQDKLC